MKLRGNFWQGLYSQSFIIVFVDLHGLVVDDQQVAGKVLENSAPFPDLYPRGVWKAIKEPFD